MSVICMIRSVADLEKTEDPPIDSSRSADPRIQSGPSVDDDLPPVESSRSTISTGRASSAVTKDVINFLEKVDVDAKLGDIDQVRNCCTGLISDYSLTLL